MSKLLWWGYEHTNGTIHLKRFFSKQDIEEAIESPFVLTYQAQFEADNATEALKILKTKLR